MSDDYRPALTSARKLVRTFGSAPDPRRRAQEVLSELKRDANWSVAAQHEIAALESWLRSVPSVDALAPRLRAVLTRLA